MTLKKLLKYLDPLTDIVVWSNFDKDTLDYNDDPEFEGSAMDCPWYLANYKLVETKEATDGYEGMRAAYVTNEYGATIPKLILEVDMKADLNDK